MQPEHSPAAPPRRQFDDAEDARLIARIAAGELRAFDAVYRGYHPRLVRFLQQMTHRAGVVDEALNDTLFVVWRSASRFDGRSKVSSWIFGIAYRKVLKGLRGVDEPQPDRDDDAASSDAGPEQRRGHAELHTALLAALARLSPDHRAVVSLTYFHDMGYREIADVVGCPVDTVKTRMFHARRRLRTLLPGSREDWL